MGSSRMADLETLAKDLQWEIAMADDLATPTRRGSDQSLGLQLMKLQDLKIKMYKEVKHSLPHVHIDIGKSNHDSSFGISPAELLVGEISKRHEKVIIAFIERNRDILLQIWAGLKDGGDVTELVVEVRA